MLCFVLTSLSWRMRYQFVSISLTLLRSLSESVLYCSCRRFIVWEGRGRSRRRFTNVLAGDKAVIWPELMPPLGQMGPTPSLVIILTRLLAPIETCSHIAQWTMIQETRSAQTRVWHDFCENVNLNNCVYLCLHLLNDCHRHFCLSVVTKTNIAQHLS